MKYTSLLLHTCSGRRCPLALRSLARFRPSAAQLSDPPLAAADGRAPPVLPLLATEAELDSGPTPASVPHRFPRGPARPGASPADYLTPPPRIVPPLSSKTIALELHTVAANPSARAPHRRRKPYRATAVEPLVRRSPVAEKVAWSSPQGEEPVGVACFCHRAPHLLERHRQSSHRHGFRPAVPSVVAAAPAPTMVP
jgi:hypothetical protein